MRVSGCRTVSIVVLAGTAFAGAATARATPAAPPTPDITASPNPIDLGNVPVGFQGSASFDLDNNSDTQVPFVGSLVATDGFSPASSPISLTFEPGQNPPVSQSFMIMYTPSAPGAFNFADSVGIYDDSTPPGLLQSVPVTGYGFGIQIPIDLLQSVTNVTPPTSPGTSLMISSAVALREISIVPVSSDTGFTVAMTSEFFTNSCVSGTATDCIVNPDAVAIPSDTPLLVPVTCTATIGGAHYVNIVVTDSEASPVSVSATLECDGIENGSDNALTSAVAPPQFASPTMICLGDLWGPGINGDVGGSGVTLTLTNSGEFPFTVQTLDIAQDLDLFSFGANSEMPIPATLGPGQNLPNLLFFNSAMAATNPPLSYQATVSWSATGGIVGSQPFVVTTLADATINSGTTIAFPNTPLGGTSTQSISVAMCGDREGELSASVNQPDGQTAFQLLSSPSQNISGTDSTVDVQFTPTADGTFHATLVVNIQDIGTNDGVSTTETGNVTSATIDLYAAGSGAGLQSYYESGCRISDSSGGVGAILLSLGTIVVIGGRRRKIVSHAS